MYLFAMTIIMRVSDAFQQLNDAELVCEFYVREKTVEFRQK